MTTVIITGYEPNDVDDGPGATYLVDVDGAPHRYEVTWERRTGAAQIEQSTALVRDGLAVEVNDESDDALVAASEAFDAAYAEHYEDLLREISARATAAALARLALASA